MLERLDAADEMGRRVRLTVDLQDDFALNQPLSLFVLEAVPRLDDGSPDVGARCRLGGRIDPGGPWPVLQAQLERLRTETLAQLKEEGMEYEERMEVLRELEHPKPLADFLYDVFDEYRVRHPWARDHNVHPKSIVRDMYERSMSFAEYVAHYGIARSEGLSAPVPVGRLQGAGAKRPRRIEVHQALRDLSEWLGEMVRQVDSSLLDEWELLSHPADLEAALAEENGLSGPGPGGEPPPLTSNVRAFRVMVRNACFRRAELAARTGLGHSRGDRPGGRLGRRSVGGGAAALLRRTPLDRHRCRRPTAPRCGS